MSVFSLCSSLKQQIIIIIINCWSCTPKSKIRIPRSYEANESRCYKYLWRTTSIITLHDYPRNSIPVLNTWLAKLSGIPMQLHALNQSSDIWALILANYVHTQSCNLPESDSIWPHISGWGELSIRDRLNGHPLPGQTTFSCLDVDLVLGIHSSRHTKVSNLQHFSLSNQDITTGQVTVNYVKARDILLQECMN